jgi:hypothetical protein
MIDMAMHAWTIAIDQLQLKILCQFGNSTGWTVTNFHDKWSFAMRWKSADLDSEEDMMFIKGYICRGRYHS